MRFSILIYIYMTAILQVILPNTFSWERGVVFYCNFAVVHQGLIENKSSLFPVVAWPWPGDDPFPEPMQTHFNDTYVRHPASLCLPSRIHHLGCVFPEAIILYYSRSCCPVIAYIFSNSRGNVTNTCMYVYNTLCVHLRRSIPAE